MKDAINGGNSHLDHEKLKFHKFKVIEIIDSETVETHMQFTHPIYDNDNKVQKIYISDDHRTMLEVLHGHKIFLY